jgi:REP element-mobilizing transposase RayT
MARIPRLTVDGEPAVYHVISRTALDGFVLGDMEKDYLLTLIQHLSAVYFTEVLGFCLMGNHFHLLVRMHPETAFSDDEIRKRFQHYYSVDRHRQLMDGQIPTLLPALRVRARCPACNEGGASCSQACRNGSPERVCPYARGHAGKFGFEKVL